MTDRLGAHMSIAGGLHLALTRGHALGCSVVQIFLKNQRQWRGKPLTAADVQLWRQARRATGIRIAFAHATYLINLATPNDAEWRQAVDAFHDELERAEAIGLAFVVIHAGSHRGAGPAAGAARVVAAIDELTRRTAGYRVKVVLENAAGGGHALGRTFAELALLVDRARDATRVGVCLDTCHLFAAGYDIRTRAGYERAVTECGETVGLSRIEAFHVNDSKGELGSGLDRHASIGEGRLGLAPFRFLLNDPRFQRLPKVLETPKEPEPETDLRNLATLRRLIRTHRGRPGAGSARGSGATPLTRDREGPRVSART